MKHMKQSLSFAASEPLWHPHKVGQVQMRSGLSRESPA